MHYLPTEALKEEPMLQLPFCHSEESFQKTNLEISFIGLLKAFKSQWRGWCGFGGGGGNMMQLYIPLGVMCMCVRVPIQELYQMCCYLLSPPCFPHQLSCCNFPLLILSPCWLFYFSCFVDPRDMELLQFQAF